MHEDRDREEVRKMHFCKKTLTKKTPFQAWVVPNSAVS
jgi:hypothetical protein